MSRRESPKSPATGREGPSQRVVQQQAKALGVPARYELFRRIADATTPVTIADLTAASGLHHNAVRQHLAVLVAARLVDQETEHRGGRGRPRLRYHLAPGTDGRWARVGPYERLSHLLLDVLRSGDTPFEVGRREGRREAADLAAPTPVGALVDAMAGHGFAPSASPSDGPPGRVTIVLDACPFERAAATDPATVCQLHLGLAHGVAEQVGGITVDDLVAKDPRSAGCVLHCSVAI